MARKDGKPYNPRFSPEFESTVKQFGTYVASIKGMPADARANAITQALKNMVAELGTVGIIAKDTVDYKHNHQVDTHLASTTFLYKGAIRDFPKAKAAMERLADTAAQALLGSSSEDTVTRYPLNPNAVNALNSSSLLVVQNKSGATTGIYHVSGDQLNGGLEYKPINLLQAGQLLDEAIKSAQVRDGFNASIPEYAKQELKYQDLKNTFIKATARYDDSSVTPTPAQELQANQKTIRPVWLQNIERMQIKKPSTDAFEIAYNSFWNKVINNTENFIDGSSRLLHEQPVLLNAEKGSKNWQQYLFLIEQDGVPKLFLATADLEKHAVFTEIDATCALELGSTGYDGNAALKAAQKFTDLLKRYEYPLPESLLSTETAARNNTKPASPGNRQSGFAYTAPDWLVENFPNSDKSPANSILSRLQNTIIENPAWSKSAANIALLPALYTIAEETQAAYVSSGMQSAMNTASQQLTRLYAGIEAGVAVSPYTLPLLATPHGEIAYMASTMAVTMAGSQTLEALENGTMYLWQKLAVEPLPAQANEREQLKQQEQSTHKRHQEIVNSIPHDPPLKKSATGTLAQHIAVNAAQSGWSIEKTCETLQALFQGNSSARSEYMQAAQPSVQPAGQDVVGP